MLQRRAGGILPPQITLFDGKIVFIHPQFSGEYNLRPAGAVVSTYKDLVARRKPATVRGGGG